MKFTMRIDPPTTTAQQHRFGGFAANGRAILYDSPKLREAKHTLAGALIPNAPAEPFKGAIALTVRWFFKTTDKKKQGRWKISRPDTDNLQKLFKDEMTKAGFWKDDAQVCAEYVEKYWSEQGHIDVTITELPTAKE